MKTYVMDTHKKHLNGALLMSIKWGTSNEYYMGHF